MNEVGIQILVVWITGLVSFGSFATYLVLRDNDKKKETNERSGAFWMMIVMGSMFLYSSISYSNTEKKKEELIVKFKKGRVIGMSLMVLCVIMLVNGESVALALVVGAVGLVLRVGGDRAESKSDKKEIKESEQ